MNSRIGTALSVAIDAQIVPGKLGGVETYLTALIKSLGQLDGPERYLVVCLPEYQDWLKPHLSDNQHILSGPRTALGFLRRYLPSSSWSYMRNLARQHIHRNDQVRFMKNGALKWEWKSNGFYESLGVRLVHMFHQRLIDVELPVIFNPHDLQHEHYPNFFSAEELTQRKFVYRTACQNANVVAAASRFTANDVMHQYDVSRTNIRVIPFASATESVSVLSKPELIDLRMKHSLPEHFFYYPAATWPHKNHVRLLEAVLSLRQQGLFVNLVLCGAPKEPVFGQISAFVESNRMQSQIFHLGFLPHREVRALYQLCDYVIVPSMFEQASGPVYEAWAEGKAVGVSRIASLEEQVGSAAVLFDPVDVATIADTIAQLEQNESLRFKLAQAGKTRLGSRDWSMVAKQYRAVYRLVARWPLSLEDVVLLEQTEFRE